jgi:indole-3-glycerol phosphate synthase
MNILKKIVEVKKREVQLAKKSKAISDFDISKPVLNFEKALTYKQPAIIAEIKKASPSKGIICSDFNPARIGKDYAQNGAACLSVLTDEQFFQGNNDYISQVKNSCELPILRKDFIIDSYQIIQSRALDADCILLIVAILDDHQLLDFCQYATECQLSILVECHTHQEVERALTLPTNLVGINNRDLTTFKTDINTTIELAKYIPDDKIIITESGINSKEDIKFMLDNKIHTFLIGESLMREKNPGQKLQELIAD